MVTRDSHVTAPTPIADVVDHLLGGGAPDIGCEPAPRPPPFRINHALPIDDHLAVHAAMMIPTAVPRAASCCRFAAQTKFGYCPSGVPELQHHRQR
jgi:hypothetical protein